MATRYWVGGSGTWSSTNTANWSASSGGAGGASVPTSADDVVFDANSYGGFTACNLTLDSAFSPIPCKNFTNLGVIGPLAISATSTCTLAIYGGLVLDGTYTTISFSGSPAFSFLGTGGTVTSNGITTIPNIAFNNASGVWTLGSSLSCGAITLTSGTFITANFSLTLNTFVSTGSASRSLQLGSSAVAINSPTGWNISSTGWTSFNAGTSTITFALGNTNYTFGGQTYYNITYTSTTAGGVHSLDSFTANRLSFPAMTSGTTTAYVFSGNVTLLDTIVVNTAAANNRRVMLRSSSLGTQRTITCANNPSTFGTVDLRDIAFSCPSSVTGTSIGDCGGNSGVTFTAAKNVYWNLPAGGTYVSATAFALTSTGTPSLANYPLAQDTLFFTNAGLNASTTIGFSVYLTLPNINGSALTNSNTLSFTASTLGAHFYGSFILGSSQIVAGTGSIFFENRNPSFAQVNTNGVTMPQPITIDCPGGGIAINGGNFVSSIAAGVTHNSGTINLSAGNNFQAVKYTAPYTGLSKGFVFGGNLILTGSGTAVFNVADGTGFVVSGTSGYVKLTFSGATATTVVANSPSGPISAFPFWFSAGTYNLTFLNTANEAANRVSFAGFSGKWNNTFPAGGVALYGNIEFSSAMTFTTGYSYSLSVGAGDSGSYTITTNGKTIPFAMQVIGAGGTLALADAYTTTAGFAVSVGNFNLNGYTLTTPSFLVSSSIPKNITFNGGTISVSGDFTTASAANLTTTAGTGPGYISMTSASAKNFSGGGLDYSAATLQQSGAGPLTISGSNTFYDIANTTQPVTVQFAAGSTNTFSNFSLSGTLGNQVTIASNTSATHTLSKPTGTVNVSYCTISYSVATGGATWNSLLTNGNIDNGNNTGWNFTAPASGVGAKFLMVF